ncbi:unnamed protein product, partial [Adineta steineri]
IADCGSGLGTIAFPFFIPWIMEHFFSNDYKGILVLESVLLLMCAFFGLLMVPLPIELSEQRRARLKLRAEAKRQATNKVVLDKDNNTNQLITEQQSLPFLETSPPPLILKKQRRTSVDRRYTSPSFRLNALSESETPSGGGGGSTTNSEHAWKSLSHLSPTY